MSTEKMREEFQEWFERHVVIGFKCEEDAAWAAWQASRAAIEVELRDAYMKGWEASGEGWNGEYPAMLHETERWQRERDQALGLEFKPC